MKKKTDSNKNNLPPEELSQEDTSAQQAPRALVPYSEHFGSILYPLIQSLPLNIYAKSIEGSFIFANDFYCRNVSTELEDLLDKNDFDIHPRKLAEKYVNDDSRVISSRKTLTFEEQWEALDGDNGQEAGYVNVIKSPIYQTDRNGKRKDVVIGTLGIFWDITQQKNAQLALQQSEEKHRSIIENIAEAYLELDNRCNLLSYNEALLNITGYKGDEIKGLSLFDLLLEEEHERVTENAAQATAAQATQFLDDVRFLKKDRTTGHLSLSLTPITSQNGQTKGFHSIARDISERIRTQERQRKIENQLVQRQKLEALGTLAGGIAHDFNNLLFLILGYTDISLKQKDNSPFLDTALHKIKDASQKASDLVKQILLFARTEKKEHRVQDLEALVHEMVALLRSALPANVHICYEPEESVEFLIKTDRTEIHQILMNLGTNGAHAIGENNGRLTISLKRVLLDDHFVAQTSNLKAGPHALLSVSDTGKGMDIETQRRIFEPFFTTKKKDEGTGLGLSVVHGLIQAMSGYISLYSEPGEGTSFHLYFPLAEEPVKQKKEEPASFAKGHGQHLLLVDDNPEILAMLANMVTDMGYNCTTATNGKEALDTFMHSPDTFDCILTDQTMPVMTGMEMAQIILKEHTEMRIILCTGFAKELTREKAEAAGISIFLNKPVLQDDLNLAIQQALATTS